MYGVGAIYGFAMSGVSAYARSVFGEIIPPGSESALFALYAITDKGASARQPALQASLELTTTQVRPCSDPQLQVTWFNLFVRGQCSDFLAGFITDKTGNIRYAFWFLLVLLLIPLPLLGMIDVQRGKRDSRKVSLDTLGVPADHRHPAGLTTEH